jgi:hypothetical protein
LRFNNSWLAEPVTRRLPLVGRLEPDDLIRLKELFLTGVVGAIV